METVKRPAVASGGGWGEGMNKQGAEDFRAVKILSVTL